MIMIAGSTVQPENIDTEYAPNDVERKTIDLLSSSNERYVYDSLDQLKFELQLRKEIIAASRELNESNMAFAGFRETKCNPDYWNRTEDGGFALKDGAKPNEAIRDIFENSAKYATECATAMMIVYYKALLNIYSESLFNKSFSKIELMNWHHIDRLLQEVGFMKKRMDYFPGDRRYFANPDVDPLTPEWQGENVIDLDGELYYGHGIGIYNAKTITKALNKNRSEGADESAYLKDSAGRPNFKNLADLYHSSNS